MAKLTVSDDVADVALVAADVAKLTKLIAARRGSCRRLLLSPCRRLLVTPAEASASRREPFHWAFLSEATELPNSSPGMSKKVMPS